MKANSRNNRRARRNTRKSRGVFGTIGNVGTGTLSTARNVTKKALNVAVNVPIIDISNLKIP